MWDFKNVCFFFPLVSEMKGLRIKRDKGIALIFTEILKSTCKILTQVCFFPPISRLQFLI